MIQFGHKNREDAEQVSPLARGFLVFIGGGLGASTRYWLGLWISSRAGVLFPWNTFAINVSGSFLIGLVLGWLGTSPSGLGWKLFLVVGVLGGYTTFSSFAMERLNLMREKSYSYASAYVIGSVALGLIACWIGTLVAHSILKS